MNVRLLAVDLDGTLLDSRKQIGTRTRDLVLRARDAGVLVVLVTGRRLPAARRIADQLWPGVTLVLHNGALIVEGGRVIRCHPLPLEVARDAVALGRSAGADPVLHVGIDGETHLVVGPLDPANAKLAAYLARAGDEVEVVDDVAAALREPPLEVMFGGPFSRLGPFFDRLRAELGGRARVERTVYRRDDLTIMDVVHAGTGKAEAVAFLERRHGLSADDTLAIGDNWNDREMLAGAGRGLVMGNAEPELRALGFEVLPSNDDDGVAVALERYVTGVEARS